MAGLKDQWVSREIRDRRERTDPLGLREIRATNMPLSQSPKADTLA